MRITQYNVKINRNTERTDLVKEKSVNYQKYNTVNNPHYIANIMNDLFDMENLAEEHLYMIAVNTKCKIQGIFEVSHGTINASLCSIRSIFNRALMIGAANIILVHNHPSGDCTQSNLDVDITEKIKEAGKLLDIPLLDHIIIGNKCYMSFMERGNAELSIVSLIVGMDIKERKVSKNEIFKSRSRI